MSLKWLLGLEMNGKTVLDIGAHRGIYSYWMSKAVGPQGSVFAFEPQPECVAHLEKVKTEFQLANLEIVPQGLSENPGTLPLWREYPESGSSSMESSVDAKQGNYEAIAASVRKVISKTLMPPAINARAKGTAFSASSITITGITGDAFKTSLG